MKIRGTHEQASNNTYSPLHPLTTSIHNLHITTATPLQTDRMPVMSTLMPKDPDAGHVEKTNDRDYEIENR